MIVLRRNPHTLMMAHQLVQKFRNHLAVKPHRSLADLMAGIVDYIEIIRGMRCLKRLGDGCGPPQPAHPAYGSLAERHLTVGIAVEHHNGTRLFLPFR